MSAPDSRAPDAALRQRVRDAVFREAQFGVDRMTDAVLAAIPEPAATLTPRRVELDGGLYATWSEQRSMWDIYGVGRRPMWTCSCASSIVSDHVEDVLEKDAKHAELIALKSEEVKPWGWVNVYEADPCIIRWNSEAEAKEAAVRGAKYVTRPLYEHPPAPTPALQSETRKVER